MKKFILVLIAMIAFMSVFFACQGVESVAKATIQNITIEGVKGSPFAEPINVVVSLENDKFKASSDIDNVDTWFTNLPAGLQANIRQDIEEGATEVTIAVVGTPSEAKEEAIKITIPANVLNSGKKLVAEINSNAKWDIAPGPSVTILP